MFGEWSGLVLQFAVTVVVVLALIVGVFWLLRRYSAGGLGRIGRGRVPRLAIIDSMSVDGRRRLVLVRRDNVEHLILVGGPSDLVVEQAIQRPRRPAQRPQPTDSKASSAVEAPPVIAETAAEAAPAPAATPEAVAPEVTVAPMSEAAPENPPIPFPRPQVADAGQVEAPRTVTQAAGRSFFPLRRVASGQQPTRVEPTSMPISVPGSDAPEMPMPEVPLAPEAPPATGEPDRTYASEPQPAEAAGAGAQPNNISPFAGPSQQPVKPDETATRVNDLEREMARLLGEITGRQSG